MPVQKVSSAYLIVGALLAVSCLCIVEVSKVVIDDPVFHQKVQAAHLTLKAFEILKAEKERLGITIDSNLDPNKTGMIGIGYSDLTTTMGSLSAKRTAANPNFAGLMVQWLLESGVKAHDDIWVSLSGSFPTFNIAAFSAIHVLEGNPIIISSIGASMYGANDPRMTWLDMERILREHGVFKFKSIAASLGGVIDTKGGLDGTGIQFGIQNIRKNKVPYLHEGGITTLTADIEERLRIYEYASNGRKPSAFINVGGVLPSLGNIPEAYALGVGLITKVPKSNHPERGIIFFMVERGMPVIHILDIKKLAREHGLPVDPAPMPEIPDGAVMRPHRYLKPLAWAGLAFLIAGAWIAARPKRKINMFSVAPS